MSYRAAGNSLSAGGGTRAGAIYLDYHATTPVDPRVVDVIVRHMTSEFGNASSADHTFGDSAEQAVNVAAIEVGRLVGAPPSAITWTSGATEAINLAIHGMALWKLSVGGKSSALRVTASPTEHSAVLDTCRVLARSGAIELRILGVDGRGRVDLEEVERACREGTDLLCVMAANNEVGTIAPVPQIAGIAQKYGVAYLCDATQACGRIPLDVEQAGITFLALSAHKIHGPQGVGALVTMSRRLLMPILHGGEQQRQLRAGTLNLPGIAGLGAAAALRRAEMHEDERAIAAHRDHLQSIITSALGADVLVNGDTSHRLAGNLHLSFLRVPNTAMIARMRDRLAVATGAACSSRVDAPSHVLRAMRLSTAAQEGAIRIGLGKWTNADEIECAAAMLIQAAEGAASALGASGEGRSVTS